MFLNLINEIFLEKYQINDSVYINSNTFERSTENNIYIIDVFA
jgi:hypothetical protein